MCWSWSCRVLLVELLDHPGRVLQVRCWLPSVVFVDVALPLHPILQPPPPVPTVQNFLYLVLWLVLVLPLHWCWRFRQQTIDQISLEWIELVDVEDGVMAIKLLWEVQSIV